MAIRFKSVMESTGPDGIKYAGMSKLKFGQRWHIMKIRTNMLSCGKTTVMELMKFGGESCHLMGSV
ncbi:MAG: hypothetical protein C5S49_05320 [Candidatus Methanogaster sp.]|nr:MAG: hypothetical protein C5S49_05320 [ANME-2 cluster archaeon]